MQAFDASSMIYAWDNYPEGQFPGLWSWMCDQITSAEFVMSKVAFDEVKQKMPECATWLKQNDLKCLRTTNGTLQIAVMIKELLSIENDQYGDGVGENDILIVASAKEHHHELVSNERRQATLPQNTKNYKIPAVCAMRRVDVTCIPFIDLIKQSGTVFH